MTPQTVLPFQGTRSAEERDRLALAALISDYPLGTVVRFRSYDPTIRPRSWRRVAERAAWGLQRDDVLTVVGYGDAQGLPDALSARRSSDAAGAPDVLVWPDELLRHAAIRRSPLDSSDVAD